ncbi:hypothetical protein NKR23_g4380 [Pleurostoma richardsiae]|uniref:UbiD family decarboxylase n=1 Tax=Pleurostoma richardsiae TaxID=41990 RepID=A0AA38RJF8_9PEZI|nr:hypothetical protein NKR23_g4380 [Pleurostoma richardsiae]
MSSQGSTSDLPKHDLRTFLALLNENRELLKVDEQVDWDLEIGAVARRLCDRETNGVPSPAVLFENVKDYPGGRFFCNTLASYRRYALALGLPIDTPISEIIATYSKRINTPIKPVEVKEAPCKENIIHEQEVDLLKMFATPKWHAEDGHRYIGTYHAIVVKDPDGPWVNWSLQRLGIHDEKSTGMLISYNSHAGKIYSKYEAIGKPMPVAVAIGLHPIDCIVASSGFPDQVNEVDMAGALRGAPIELVKCETNDLLVPAGAEIILEGVVLPGERRKEGPLGEYTGYYSDKPSPKPVLHVKCITHRTRPIHQGSLEGVPIVDDHLMSSVAQSGLCLNLLRDVLRIPGVKSVYFPPSATGWHLCIVSADRKGSPGLPVRITSAIWGSKFAATQNMAGWVIVVDEDIDVTNMNQVIWSMISRCDPERGIQITRRRSAHLLLPAVSTDVRTKQRAPSSSVMIDAGFPEEWYVADPDSIQPVVNWDNLPGELKESASGIVDRSLQKFRDN